MADFNLSLFGGFRLMVGANQEIQVPSKKGKALLAYLALNPEQQHTRDKLIGLLWPDRDEKQARHSLRQELLVLHKLMNSGPEAVSITADRLAINTKAFNVDVWSFELLEKENTLEVLQEAANHYAGDLMEGLHIGSTEIEQWYTSERMRLKELACNVLERLSEARAESGDMEAAIKVAQKLAFLDPLRERAHRCLMRLYHQVGRRTDALRQYQSCVDILRRELDVSPEADTLRLYDEIHDQKKALQGGSEEVSSINDGKHGPLSLPDRPSIAVLPFKNLSEDIDQEYFADGIAEDITTTLGRFRWFFVIAHNSTITYKGKPIDVKQVARELGVRYVLEGSVRKVGQRVRVTVELSDTSSGQHIWADRYDRKLIDIFAMQDEISQAVIASVMPQFLQAEADRAKRKNPENFDAWDCWVRGRWHLWQFNKTDNAEGKRLFRQSIELDTTFAPALADLAIMHMLDALFGWIRPEWESLEIAKMTAAKALHYDDQDAWAHVVVGLVDAMSKRYEDGIQSLERAIEINPNFAAAHGGLGWAEVFVGQTVKAVKELESAIRLSPRDPLIMVWHTALSGAAFVEGNYVDAARWARRAMQERKDFPSAHRLLAASLGQMGKDEEARTAVMDVLRLIPDQTVTNLAIQLPYQDPEVRERFVEGLRRGGLPE